MLDRTPGDFLQLFDSADVARALDYPRLIEALRSAFRDGAEAPPRQVLGLADGGGHLVTMPIWRPAAGAVKIATLFPANPDRHGKPSVQSLVVLFDGATGTPTAVADGNEITLRRTAAASALAAGYLARPDARSLLMIGAGALAPHLIGGHAAVRPIRRVEVWARSPDKARALAAAVAVERPDLEVTASDSLAVSASRCDIISCATGAAAPILQGAWLSPGVHVDLVGAFSPETREADDDVVRGARIFVDTWAGGLREAGDLLIPIAAGVLARADIAGDLADLCGARVPGRTAADQVTVFKSVGSAIEDLAAAQLLLEGAS
ncbi:MAG TPA: ornithine cyclodeaminase family protein [Caulobacteraceae bacterium]|jgi:ornithine cyclodeaminase|nr:ornithine cyclodeaminase family protein [Caulobacteraceae bacterium]